MEIRYGFKKGGTKSDREARKEYVHMVRARSGEGHSRTLAMGGVWCVGGGAHANNPAEGSGSVDGCDIEVCDTPARCTGAVGQGDAWRGGLACSATGASLPAPWLLGLASFPAWPRDFLWGGAWGCARGALSPSAPTATTMPPLGP